MEELHSKLYKTNADGSKTELDTTSTPHFNIQKYIPKLPSIDLGVHARLDEIGRRGAEREAIQEAHRKTREALQDAREAETHRIAKKANTISWASLAVSAIIGIVAILAPHLAEPQVPAATQSTIAALQSETLTLRAAVRALQDQLDSLSTRPY